MPARRRRIVSCPQPAPTPSRALRHVRTGATNRATPIPCRRSWRSSAGCAPACAPGRGATRRPPVRRRRPRDALVRGGSRVLRCRCWPRRARHVRVGRVAGCCCGAPADVRWRTPRHLTHDAVHVGEQVLRPDQRGAASLGRGQVQLLDECEEPLEDNRMTDAVGVQQRLEGHARPGRSPAPRSWPRPESCGAVRRSPPSDCSATRTLP